MYIFLTDLDKSKWFPHGAVDYESDQHCKKRLDTFDMAPFETLGVGKYPIEYYIKV